MPDETKGRMSRRKFLRSAAVGAATVGALAAAPNMIGLTENAGADLSLAAGSGDPVVAYVQDAGTGTIVVMSGTKEFVTRDPILVSRLLAYARR